MSSLQPEVVAPLTAEITVDQRHLVKTMRWFDGFVLALAVPAGMFSGLGYTIASVGGWGAAALWGVSALIATMQNRIYSELAVMFPEKSGGISLYAHEGWRRYCTLVGPIAAFGYWAGWSTGLSVFGLIIGSLIKAQWFSGATWTISDSFVRLGLQHFIAAGAIVFVWLLNVFGLRPAVRLSYVIGAVLLLSIAVFIFGPFITGTWHASNLTWGFSSSQPWGGLKLAFAFLFVIAYTAYSTEMSATFAPEFHDTNRDTAKSLISSGIFCLIVFTLLPIGLVGAVGTKGATADPIGFYAPAFAQILGGASGIMIVMLIAACVLCMAAATADASRALYGIAGDGMTVRQLHHLNRHNVPGRAMAVDLVVNLLLVFAIGDVLGILLAANLGYVTCHALALSGFLLLRRDRPSWPRPIRVGRIAVGASVALLFFNLVLIGVGVSSPSLTGYGGTKDVVIGVAILVGSVMLYLFRRLVQDREPLQLRDPSAPVERQQSSRPAVR